ncbi:MAG: PcfJ domain-containing protein [Thiomonas sp.]
MRTPQRPSPSATADVASDLIVGHLRRPAADLAAIAWIGSRDSRRRWRLWIVDARRRLRLIDTYVDDAPTRRDLIDLARTSRFAPISSRRIPHQPRLVPSADDALDIVWPEDEDADVQAAGERIMPIAACIEHALCPQALAIARGHPPRVALALYNAFVGMPAQQRLRWMQVLQCRAWLHGAVPGDWHGAPRWVRRVRLAVALAWSLKATLTRALGVRPATLKRLGAMRAAPSDPWSLQALAWLLQAQPTLPDAVALSIAAWLGTYPEYAACRPLVTALAEAAAQLPKDIVPDWADLLEKTRNRLDPESFWELPVSPWLDAIRKDALLPTMARHLPAPVPLPKSAIPRLTWPAKLPVFRFAGLDITELTSTQALIREGQRMRHCIADYWPACLAGTHAVAHVRRESDGHEETWMWRGPFPWRIVERRGRGNSDSQIDLPTAVIDRYSCHHSRALPRPRSCNLTRSQDAARS